jgi:hypothetical protein
MKCDLRYVMRTVYRPTKHLKLSRLIQKEGEVRGRPQARFIKLEDALAKRMVEVMERGEVVVVDRSAEVTRVTQYSNKGCWLHNWKCYEL